MLRHFVTRFGWPTIALTFLSIASTGGVFAADKLIGLHSAQVMSQSMPWIAQEAGLFKKHDLDFRLVFIPSLIELEKTGAFGK